MAWLKIRGPTLALDLHGFRVLLPYSSAQEHGQSCSVCVFSYDVNDTLFFFSLSLSLYIYTYTDMNMCIHIYIYICIYGRPLNDPSFIFLTSTTYSGRLPSASHEKFSLCVQGYITFFSHTRGRAPLNRCRTSSYWTSRV